MAIGSKLFCILLWISCLYVVGIVIFTKGFLLKRLAIPNKSDCSILIEEQSVFSISPQDGAPDDDGAGGSESDLAGLGSRLYIKDVCSAQSRFKKAIILLVDALRYDFLLYNDSIDKSRTLPFQNKLPIIKTLLDKKPTQSILYKFMADPPTTTMQRLKGLTTGSLPTFVDIGNNFASSEIEEDSIIYQLVNASRNITFMGDDTWESLFTDKFTKSYPFPSFNVKDLHTVDNGIMEHLLPEMNQSDWSMLIAHFLGVDHCGHRYGPYHSAMGDKLSQMNDVISSVVDNMADDTLLLVFGDHGMTGTGDHGGDSDDELAAGLFLYSPKQLQISNPKNGHRTVSQIDLVPSLSLLLGIPIPFSSLGMLIPELFTLGADVKSSELLHSLSQLPQEHHPAYLKMEALRINALQIKRYLDSYSRKLDEFPHHLLGMLEQKFANAETLFVSLKRDLGDDEIKIWMDGATAMYFEYLSGVKDMCRTNWAKFDLLSMACGVVVTASTCVVTWLILNFIEGIGDVNKIEDALNSLLGNMLTGMIMIFPMSVLITSQVEDLIVVKTTILLFFPALGSILGSLLCIFEIDGIASLSDTLRYLKHTSWDSLCASVLFLFYVVSLTSNSFVVYEDRTCVFLLQVIVVFSFVISGINSLTNINKSKSDKSRDIGRILTHPVALLTYIFIAFQVCVRLSFNYRTCREEQVPCTQPDFLQPLLVFDAENSAYNNFRYLKAVIAVSIIPFILKSWLLKQGNLNGSSGAVLCVKYALPTIALCIFLHWGLQSVPEKVLDKLPVWQQTFFAKCVYALSIVSIISIIWQPLLIRVLERRKEASHKSVSNVEPSNSVIPQLFDHMKSKFQNRNGRGRHGGRDENDFETPVVFGLASNYSACFLHLIATVVLVLSMLLGDGVSPAVLLLCVQGLLYLEFVSCIRRARLKVFNAVPKLALFQVPWHIVVGWGLMASQFFFVTGHHATFPSIQFEAGFVGFHGDFPVYLYFIPAFLIGANTFASYIIFALALPLVLLWPFTRGKIAEKKNSNDEGEVVLCHYGSEFCIGLFRLVVLYILFHGCKLLGCMLSAAIHRRHLMIWKIFTPRYVFDGIAFLVTLALVLLTYLMVLRIDNKLSMWLTRLFKLVKVN